MIFTNQLQLRAAFWQAHPDADRRMVPSHDGKGRMFRTDTRVAFVDWLDSMHRGGHVDSALAQRATLGGYD